MPTERENVLARLRDKAAGLPDAPGVYLFKDARGRVLYVGKAKSLRSRVGSYFQPSADLAGGRGPDIAHMTAELVADVDALACDSEVDALLRENRLIKDIGPRFNKDLRDGKSFPYLQVRTGEDFPRVQITREPLRAGVKLYGPFTSVSELRAAVPLLQRVFRFRTCKLDIKEGDERRRHFRPCILHAIKQCTAPCAARIDRSDYRRDVADLMRFLDSKGSIVARRLKREMAAASAAMNYERAAVLRDELRALDGLQKRGLAHEDLQPEVFFVDPGEGLLRLGEILHLKSAPRIVEAVDVAHLAGGESAGATVCFIDGKPFKQGYRRFRIRTAEPGDPSTLRRTQGRPEGGRGATSSGSLRVVSRGDDYAAIGEVVARRYRRAGTDEELFPDLILIDGGQGQLAAAAAALDTLPSAPPVLAALAKKEETLYVRGRAGPVRISRHDPALRLLQSVRDEAHRFAQLYHHILRRKKTLELKKRD